MKKLIFTALFLLSAFVKADAVYTMGDAASQLLAHTYVPERVAIGKPGAEGLLLWRDLIADSKGISIQPPQAVHIIDIVHGEYSNKAELVATLAQSNMYLFADKSLGVKNISDMKKKEYSVATVGENGICSLILKKLKKEKGVEMLLVPFKKPAEARIAFEGKHVDMLCTGGVVASEIKKLGNSNVVIDMEKDVGFKLTTYVYANKNIETTEKTELIRALSRKLTDEQKSTLTQNGLEPFVRIEKDAHEVFINERAFFQKIFTTK